MPEFVQKITLSQSRDIPFNRLVLSQANVRRKAGVSIEELVEDIARRMLRALRCAARPPQEGRDGGEGARAARGLWLAPRTAAYTRTVHDRCIVNSRSRAEPVARIAGEQSAATDYETAMADSERSVEDELVAAESPAVAAE